MLIIFFRSISYEMACAGCYVWIFEGSSKGVNAIGGKRKPHKKRLEKVEQFLKADGKRKNAKNAFVEKFILYEICCKEAIHNATGEAIEKVQLHMPDIKKGMKGYPFDKEKLKKLFYGKSGKYYKRGFFSSKNLRESIMHSMSMESIQEVYDRKDE